MKRLYSDEFIKIYKHFDAGIVISLQHRSLHVRCSWLFRLYTHWQVDSLTWRYLRDKISFLIAEFKIPKMCRANDGGVNRIYAGGEDRNVPGSGKIAQTDRETAGNKRKRSHKGMDVRVARPARQGPNAGGIPIRCAPERGPGALSGLSPGVTCARRRMALRLRFPKASWETLRFCTLVLARIRRNDRRVK